jgi:CheY-like chemotaxis protein
MVTLNLKNILVIDDDIEIQNLLKAYLKGLYTVHSAFNGEEALELLHQKTIEEPDLIILDMEMPKMGGKGFVQRVKMDSHLKHIPIIYFSADDKYKDEIELEEEFQFLNKPIEKEDLLSIIDSFFKLQR